MTGALQSASTTHPVVNLDQLGEGTTRVEGERFARRLQPVGPRIGARKLGYNVTRVPPGKRAAPFHSHCVNEEMFFILDGRGTLRYGADRFPVRSGDFVACPPGDASTAHQLVNDGDEELVYIAVSTMSETDVWRYPDSHKFGVGSGPAAGAVGAADASFPDLYFHDDVAVDYWEGES